MSHLAHFYDAPARPDRGRRAIPSVSAYQSDFDYLKDHRPLEEQTTPPVGTQSPIRFHRGFWRRPAHAIAADSERTQSALLKEARESSVWALRQARIQERTAQCTTERPFCQHRRHFARPTTSPQSPPTPPVRSPPSSSPRPLEPTTQSHILGVNGRADLLPSYGVMDAFMGDRYKDYAYVPMRERRTGRAGARAAEKVEEVRDVAAERRQRDAERERNARRECQLQYLLRPDAVQPRQQQETKEQLS